MISVDYLIERDEEDTVNNYRPDVIPSELPNLVKIEAPNSHGKSTLLNILALGLYGTKNDRISPSLRGKIRDLVESKHQSLTFDIRIDLENGNYLSTRKLDKNGHDIEVFEYIDGKKRSLSGDTFNRKYNLIYDIPDDPIARLNQLVGEIRDVQTEYGNEVRVLRIYVQDVINKIRESRDPIAISKLEEIIQADSKNYEDIESDLRPIRDNLEILERYYCTRFYSEFSLKKAESDDIIAGLQSQLDEIGDIDQANNEELDKKERTLDKNLNSMRRKRDNVYDNLSRIIPEEFKPELREWGLIDFDVIFRDLSFPDCLSKGIRAFKGVLMELGNEDRERLDVAKEADMYQELIDVLKRYRSPNVTIPGVKGTIDEFIDNLEEQKNRHQEDSEYMGRIKECMQDLDEVAELKRKIEKKNFGLVQSLRRQVKMESPVLSDYMELTNRREKEVAHNESLSKKMTHFAGLCSNCKIDLDDATKIYWDLQREPILELLADYDEAMLKDKLESEREMVRQKTLKLNEMGSKIKYNKDELKRLNKKEPHPMHDKMGSLEKISMICRRMEQEFLKNYNDNIKILKEGGSFDGDDKKNTYFEEVSKYLARRIGTIRHSTRNYDPERVDLLNREIWTKSGKRIRFSDMGTGQTQSTYLLGLLGSEDNRKIIAMFDEVATMDNKSLGQVLNKMTALKNEGKLIAGIVVQKSDEVNIVDLEGSL